MTISYNALLEKLALENDTKIIYIIVDGIGGLAKEGKDGTELQVARTPNLDSLAARSVCGVMDPIAPGITPGSGSSHLALFGYDPFEYNIGRGILSALGIDFKLTDRDLAARVNFATVDKDGRVMDRRAGRIGDDTNRRLCKKIKEKINLGPEVEVFLETEKEHRAVLVIRGDRLHADIQDTDPQKVGALPKEPDALTTQAEETVRIVKRFLSQVKNILADEHPANMLLLRGFSRYTPLPTLKERFKLKSLAIANYPMYRGFARLMGMDIHPAMKSLSGEFDALKEVLPRYDFIYLHVKEADSRGEDGKFDEKVRVIEEVDTLIPKVTELEPDVIVITGDHSTPALLKGHSWHPVPVLIYSKKGRVDEVKRFDEISCLQGGLGHIQGVHLMGLALAHAGRLAKYGA